MKALMETNVSGFECRRGKVRDIYDVGDGRLVIIATDRVSGFDVTMKNGIPDRGRVLTQLTEFWTDSDQICLDATLNNDLFPRSFLFNDPDAIPEAFKKPEFEGRIMLCQKAQVLPVECVVRGYITGSGWKEYQRTGRVCGIELPPHLKECAKLSEPIFTPATKAEAGEHDENISFASACRVIGKSAAKHVRDWSIKLYKLAHEFAIRRGIIIADTKFEFGTIGNEIFLIDEVLTPDSSRFWPADDYEPGRSQDSFDKQIVRDYLQKLCDAGEWDKTAPGPTLPDEIVQRTRARYLEIYKFLTGQKLQA